VLTCYLPWVKTAFKSCWEDLHLCRSSEHQTVLKEVFRDLGEVTVGAAYQVVGENGLWATNIEVVFINFNMMA
jgi:hypothetical protein